MLVLKIHFDSSWTNSFFAQPGGAPLFTSGSKLTESVKNLKAVPLDRETIQSSKSRLAYLQALQAENPHMLYRVPVSFDRAVKGVLARLVGEVRRLSMVEDAEQNHLALRAFAAGGYAVDIDQEYSQTTRLATFEVNEIQSQGAGLITNQVLYSDTEIARYLFGHLGLSSLEDMEARMDELLKPGPMAPGLNWYPQSPSTLLDRLNTFDEMQKATINKAKKLAGNGRYKSPYADTFQALSRVLSAEANDMLAKQQTRRTQGEPDGMTIENGGLDGWSITGAITVARIRMLPREEKARLIEKGALTSRGNLSGMSMSGNVGNSSLSAKDFYAWASGVKVNSAWKPGEKAKSNRMPYSINMPVPVQKGDKETTQYVPTGVLKKTGTLTFTLKDAPALEQELHAAIQAASVGPFHFGKKGIAYVQSLECY